MYSSLRVVVPPTNEPVSLQSAKLHLRLDQGSDDLLVEGLITTSRMLIEQWLGRSLINQTLLWTMSQDPPTGSLPLLPMPLLVLPVILSAPQVMNRPLELPRSPVSEVVSVQQTDQDGTVNVLATTDWIADLAIDPARLRLNWCSVPRYMQHIQVTFVAGYGPDQESVPEPLKIAMKILIAHLYENRGDTPGASEPPRVVDYLTAPYKIQYFG